MTVLSIRDPSRSSSYTPSVRVELVEDVLFRVWNRKTTIEVTPDRDGGFFFFTVVSVQYVDECPARLIIYELFIRDKSQFSATLQVLHRFAVHCSTINYSIIHKCVQNFHVRANLLLKVSIGLSWYEFYRDTIIWL